MCSTTKKAHRQKLNKLRQTRQIKIDHRSNKLEYNSNNNKKKNRHRLREALKKLNWIQ